MCSSSHPGIATSKCDRRELASDRVWVDEAGPKHRCEESDVLRAACQELGDAQILGMQAQAYRPALRVFDSNEAYVPTRRQAGRPRRHPIRVDAVLLGEVAGLAEQTVDLVGLALIVVIEGKMSASADIVASSGSMKSRNEASIDWLPMITTVSSPSIAAAARMIRWRPSRFIGIRLAAASTAESLRRVHGR